MRYGFHISIGKGFGSVPDRARELGCSTIQIFSGNPRGWQEKKLNESDVLLFRQKMEEFDIKPLVVHMPYLPNPATPDKSLYKKSLNSLINELEKAEQLNAEYVNIHIGNSMGSPIEEAIERIVKAIDTALNKVKSEVMLLLENTAGQGTEIGNKFEHIKTIIEQIDNRKRIGVCLDTAHLFEAGYDLRDEVHVEKTFTEFDKIIGLSYLKIIHYNDSMTEFNSQKDRHQHIGKGEIGEKGMKAIILYQPLTHLPFIMETPKKNEGDDVMNLKTVERYLR